MGGRYKPLTYFLPKLGYPEIEHSDLLKIVMWLETSNQSALFRQSVVALRKNLLMASAPGSFNELINIPMLTLNT